jgi:hypothetical protein
MILTSLALACALKDAPITVNVLVINLDPMVGGKPLHEAKGWGDPHALAKGYIDDVKECSGGFIRYKIAEWRDVDEFPLKADGFRYTAKSFMAIWDDAKNAHQPDAVDYQHLLSSQKVTSAIDSGRADELWVFGAPYFGFFESCMAGPGAYYINGDVVPNVKAKRAFAIMGFSYERGVAEMIHDLAHRTENHLARAYGRWKPHQTIPNPWEIFSSHVEPGDAGKAIYGCGDCHHPPNASKDYDYANPIPVLSDADGWLTYPSANHSSKEVNKDTWGGPDYQRNYLKWWFSHLPKRDGVGKDGRPLNWWKYIFDFNSYEESGKHR